jgi:hypothetical protein
VSFNGSAPYRSGHSLEWLKMKNPNAPAVKQGSRDGGLWFVTVQAHSDDVSNCIRDLRRRGVPITRLLQKASFGPEDVNVLVRAFEDALGTLQVDRNDPVAETLAKKIIEFAQQGERDPVLLGKLAVQSVPKPQ